MEERKKQLEINILEAQLSKAITEKEEAEKMSKYRTLQAAVKCCHGFSELLQTETVQRDSGMQKCVRECIQRTLRTKEEEENEESEESEGAQQQQEEESNNEIQLYFVPE